MLDQWSITAPVQGQDPNVGTSTLFLDREIIDQGYEATKEKIGEIKEKLKLKSLIKQFLFR